MIARDMPSENLPAEIDPRKLAFKGGRVAGRVALAALPRLSELLCDDRGEVLVNMDFSVTDQGLRLIQGNLRTEVQLPCQRCLEPMPQQLAADFQLAVVASDDDAKLLPRGLDPLVLAGDHIDPAEIVEEELLLTVPFVVYHPPEQCRVGAAEMQVGPEHIADPAEERPNPFQILDQLKTDK